MVIKRHKLKISYASGDRMVQLYYDRCKQVSDIVLQLENAGPHFAFKLRFPKYLIEKDSETQSFMEEYSFYTRTSADRVSTFVCTQVTNNTTRIC